MDRRLLREELERARYGRTISEAAEEVATIAECSLGFGGSGDISTVWLAIKYDAGFVEFLDEIAIERERKKGSFYFPDSIYHKKERVRNLLLNEGRLPQEVHNSLYCNSKESGGEMGDFWGLELV